MSTIRIIECNFNSFLLRGYSGIAFPLSGRLLWAGGGTMVFPVSERLRRERRGRRCQSRAVASVHSLSVSFYFVSLSLASRYFLFRVAV